MESERIKNALRACTTQAEVEAVADSERTAVRALAQSARVLAIQISNLKKYLISQLPH